MSEVALQVGGRAYKVACADGEEGHIRHLASIIDGKMVALAGSPGVSEAQSLLFAALFLADELEEARKAAPVLQTGAASSRSELIAARTLETVADTLETLARELENSAAAS